MKQFINTLKNPAVISLFFVIAVLHLLGVLRFYYDARVFWFDIVMHILGGLFIGAIALLYFGQKQKLNKSLIYQTLLIVFIVGVAWEVVEIFSSEVIPLKYRLIGTGTTMDTISDLFNDLAGALIGVILYKFRVIKGVEPEPKK